MTIEKLFSYGTLQDEPVQRSTFGRTLQGTADILQAFTLSTLCIQDADVVSISGKAMHSIISYTGQPHDQVIGVVCDISAEELAQADAYEVSAYKRSKVKMASGVEAWAYVNALCTNKD